MLLQLAILTPSDDSDAGFLERGVDFSFIHTFCSIAVVFHFIGVIPADHICNICLSLYLMVALEVDKDPLNESSSPHALSQPACTAALINLSYMTVYNDWLMPAVFTALLRQGHRSVFYY